MGNSITHHSSATVRWAQNYSLNKIKLTEKTRKICFWVLLSTVEVLQSLWGYRTSLKNICFSGNEEFQWFICIWLKFCHRNLIEDFRVLEQLIDCWLDSGYELSYLNFLCLYNFLVILTKKVIFAITTCTHKYFKSTHIWKISCCSFISLFVWIFIQNEFYIGNNYLSCEWHFSLINHPSEQRDKEKGKRRQNFPGRPICLLQILSWLVLNGN